MFQFISACLIIKTTYWSPETQDLERSIFSAVETSGFITVPEKGRQAGK